ncbi:MAG: hypothetical protein AAF215_19425 [Cyanobacteria bacterium P01_A01_bin.123]
MNQCLCCDSALLRHIRDNAIYWYCPSCRQEMPKAMAPINCELSAEFRLTLTKTPVLMTNSY